MIRNLPICGFLVCVFLIPGSTDQQTTRKGLFYDFRRSCFSYHFIDLQSLFSHFYQYEEFTCVHAAHLVETLEIKPSICLDELVTSHPAAARCLTTLLHCLSNIVNHVENGPKDWRHLQATLKGRKLLEMSQ